MTIFVLEFGCFLTVSAFYLHIRKGSEPVLINSLLHVVQEKEQRVSILKLQLESEEHDLNDKVIAKLADYTDGFSSNDLEELCRDAAGLRLEELTLDDSENLEQSLKELRKITMMDCLRVASRMKENKKAIESY
ncbi:ATPase family AAA domain-containing protein 1-like [Diaphorina citri]|uniref:ATPase family AAA domain-containing protein 1-like n=1 Tax=Diaphorina citri TaxID=121845 RepID=A0A3Q0ILY5_DIACI|nr:ATPase family AAA domain-containing protein 1-like [Diaphorina citri]